MVRAKDIMTTDVVWVKKDTPAYEAAELLLKNEITGMPVVEHDMSLVGIVTEKDLLRLFHASQEQQNKTVADYMTRPAVHYRESERLKTIVDFMLINYFRRIPVTSKEGKVVGVISRPDVLEYILQSRQAKLPVIG
jgi:CBS domain-containing protein